MTAKIRAAVAARRDPNFVLIARTDARAVSGIEDALDRAQAYVEAGADWIFPEALETQDEFAQFAERNFRPAHRQHDRVRQKPPADCEGTRQTWAMPRCCFP